MSYVQVCMHICMYTMFSMSCLYTICLHDFVTYFVYVLIYTYRLYVATMHFLYVHI